jgi:hypothetical protein
MYSWCGAWLIKHKNEGVTFHLKTSYKQETTAYIVNN